ncbi:MAG TPA: ABC transporter permease [Bryobacteraceae bacterium]|nr:ABC transporter permease [Bryobacteraceae bacterium]
MRAWRALLRQPAFLLLSVATLAVGVAASTATFSLIDQVVLSQPPFIDPGRLVTVGPIESSFWTTMSPQQYQLLLGIREFSNLGAASFSRFENLTTPNGPILGRCRPVTRSFLQTLGVKMAMGRNFTEDEDRKPAANVAVISYHLWLTQFGAGDVIGKWLTLEGKPASVVGVLPKSFRFSEPLDVLRPLGLPTNSHDRGNHLVVVGRLASGSGIQQAIAAVNTQMYSHAQELGIKQSDHVSFGVDPLQHSLSGPARSVVLLFFSFGVCLLTLVGANICNLFLVRSIGVRRSHAVRYALGAGALRLVFPNFAESILIGLFGCGAGTLLAALGLKTMSSYIPITWTGSTEGVALSGAAYGFAACFGLGVPLASCVIALRRSRNHDIADDLAAGQRVGWSARMRRTGRFLLMSQVALAGGLLIVGMSFFQSLVHLSDTNLGIRTASLLTFSVQLLQVRHPKANDVRLFAREAVAGLDKSKEGVGAAAALVAPVGGNFSIPVRVTNLQRRNIQYRPVSSAYFALLGIPLKAGRYFDMHDTGNSENVAIVNALYAKQYFSGDPIGQHLEAGLRANNRPEPMRIVGVVGNTRQFGPQAPAEPIIYVPLDQVSDQLLSEMRAFLPIQFLVDRRTGAANIGEVLRNIAPDEAVIGLAPLEQTIEGLTASEKLHMTVVMTMGMLAALIAGSGLYAIILVTATSRRRDLAIEAALGASPARIVYSLLLEFGRQLAGGLILGALIAILASSYIQKALTGFTGTAGSDLAAIISSLLVVGLAICLRPAFQVARVNPMIALRE